MDIIIQSLGFTAGESLEGFIKEKLNNLKSDDIVRANVTLYKGPANSAEGDYCEIRLEVPGNDHFVKRNSPYFETSASECVDVLNQSIKKAKDKNEGRRQADAVEIQNAIIDSDDNDKWVDLEEVVK
ncbi:MAG: HPF/RaiA family ribosome-associated protein [Ferruginibacter sp.]